MKLSDTVFIQQGDCLELMKKIPDKHVDMILCDLPYGTTDCKWDTIIPFDALWNQYERIIKDNGAICLFGTNPFSSALVMSNPKLFKYDWIWEKSTSAGFIHAKNKPMRRHEDILIFSKAPMGHISLLGEKRMKYNPQGLIPVDKVHKRPSTGAVNVIGKRNSHKKEFDVKYEGYPNTILIFKEGNNNHVHPTQKPVDLLEYLIKTYTNENEIVLDNTMGVASTGIACVNLNRKFIGYELDEKYFEIGKNRLTAQIETHIKNNNKEVQVTQ